MVLIKIGVVLLVILFGLPFVHAANLHAFHPAQCGRMGQVRRQRESSLPLGMIFFAYIGFEAVSVAAQEAKNPQARSAHRHSWVARPSAPSSTS